MKKETTKQITIDDAICKEELRKVKVSGLRTLAKRYFIQGRWEMTKEDLIDNIVKSGRLNMMDVYFNEGEECMDIKEELMEMRNKRSTKDYGKTAEVGIIIAFESPTPDRQLISGKITKIVADRFAFEVQTVKGAKYIVFPDNVKWYKTGRRWPKHIYNQLRGVPNAENEG